MRKGKLTLCELQELIFNSFNRRREEVKMHPAIGEDCAAIQTSDYILVTTDPITTECNNPGKLALHINANDIASSGGEPMAITMTILAPPTASGDDIRSLMLEAEEAARELNVEIIGGHTEFTDAVNRIIVSCTMIGRANKLISSNGAQAGDSIIMTKYAGIEGTLILNDMYPEMLYDYQEDIKWMNNNLSVVLEGKIASQLEISSMHDVTEGGIFGAIAEICNYNNLGAIINVDDIIMLAATRHITEKLGLNPYQLISSGSMIITTSEPAMVINSMISQGIPACVIGTINNSGSVIADYGIRQEEISVMTDEINKVNKGN